jgi:hypothetical protein
MTAGVPLPTPRRAGGETGPNRSTNYLVRRGGSYVAVRAMLLYALANWTKNECITAPPTESTAHSRSSVATLGLKPN